MESPFPANLPCRSHTGRPQAANRCHPATATFRLLTAVTHPSSDAEIAARHANSQFLTLNVSRA